jgi:SAM-dependent methyltransferase
VSTLTKHNPATLVHWDAGDVCCDEVWEAAYARFETPAQEIQKFIDRHRRLGVDRLPKSAKVVELFCGRGNGLRALELLGFEHLEGVDLSASLASRYRGPARVFVGDCRNLRFEDASKDLIVIQGGLHHLPTLPEDLERVLSEINRVLKPTGHVAIVEPWLTPFLRFVHTVYQSRTMRRMWSKLDALATMNEREQTTYDAWLSRPHLIRQTLAAYFKTETCRTKFGKLLFLGQPTQRRWAA